MSYNIGVSYPPDFSFTATRHNRAEFTRKWVNAFGGDQRNADRVWQVAVFENESRDMSKPFDPEETRRECAKVIA